MGERLREVAEVAAGLDVELLRVEPERRGDAQEPLHEVVRPLLLADDRERRHEPERADEERPLLAREAVVGLLGSVAKDEAVLGQLLGDGEHGVPETLVVAGQEPEDRRQQRRGVERVGLVVLAQDAAITDAVLEDVAADLLGRRPPGRLQLGVATDLGQLRGAVERDPAHELRRHVVLRLAPRLPDALVRVPPHGRRALGLRLDDRPEPSRQPLAPARVQEERVEDGAVDVVLPLVEGAVADPHRARSGVPGEVVERRLGQVAATVDPVHDLERAVVVRLDVRDELHELVRLPVEVQVVQRLQGERRVAHPRVAVVPVALAARRLGQRGRERGDRRAGRHVGQPLDREGRALDRVAPAVVRDACPPEPGTPEADRRREAGLRVRRHRRARQALGPGQGAVRLVARLEDVSRTHAAPLDAEREIRLEADRLSRSRRVGRVPCCPRASTSPARCRSRRRARRSARPRRLPRGTRPCARACGPRRRRPAGACAA